MTNVFHKLAALTAALLLSGTLFGCDVIASIQTIADASPNEVNSATVSELSTDKQPDESVKDTLAPIEVPWNLMLVRMEYPIAQVYEPELSDFRNGIQLDSRIMEDANAMFDAAIAEGLSPIAVSGYRSYQLQLRLFNNKVTREINNGLNEDEAFYSAKTVVALPGSSEHQTGLAIDIVAESYQSLDEGVESTAEIQWFYEHCTEYGFIVRYPNGKSSITGIVYEPWHFRYVGKEAAAFMTENDLTLEEYYQEYVTTETLNLVQVLD